MTRRPLATSVAVWLALATVAAGGDDPHDDHGHEEHGDHEEEVRLSAAEIDEFEIEVAAAGPGVIESILELSGEVRPNADRLAHIVPRYSGIATEVHARVGDYVERGQVLAVIESDESLAPFELQTLLSGTVIEKHITLGEAAGRDRDVFVIADLSSVWIDLAVYQRDLTRVQVGQEAQLLVGHDAVRAGTIGYITPTVDEHTRTATARLTLSNQDGFWRPGMFVTALVLVEQQQVPLAVPRTALYTLEGRTVVFVRTEDGFRPRTVALGVRGDRHVEVASGLEAGELYVSGGGFTLKAELGKGAFGDGHAH